jgi:hypothetical protein
MNTIHDQIKKNSKLSSMVIDSDCPQMVIIVDNLAVVKIPSTGIDNQ